jgi:ParB-like chromosome segregation protein Spo0J
MTTRKDRAPLKVEMIQIDKLQPYARNARTHSDSQVTQIAASIREFGFTNPVLIDGNGNIIAGHGRVLAARKLGMQAVPCIRLKHLTETQRRAYIIADNKLTLNAGWDEELLALELKELVELGFDLDLTGFSVNDLKLSAIDAEYPPVSSAQEINVNEYRMKHKCPRCGFEFNDGGKA